MKYYKITDKSLDLEQKSKGLVADIPSANGEFVPNGAFYFDRMRKREIIEDAPIFDYFHLQSFGEKKDWEWRLQDVHGGMGEYPSGAYWYISDKLKTLLEKFKIAPKYHFYETLLLYKGEKLKYWIFQFPINPLQNIIFEHSIFYYLKNNINTIIKIENESEFMKTRRKLLLEDDIELECSKVCLSKEFDIIYNLPNGDTLCSETLKQAIEENGITGFEFSELDYEVVVE
ncbi:imm11 family protein [Capnocytophaga catalasegens]|uniref:Immunity MXAN-0049 protein domain-containing protein n=1 Tax=Capnocytophaga catalasegens TaxID=1004260 RepID=A0AAV5AXT4_9FLAO|nr:hypothetical protein [Capnocytophaga catalasegens]GIZ16107.1 hypothetical protein RCZ03_21070 [Capnocytophaga catalasegens]GJM51544.1 hypothetical protein RCZ15_25170 [Capnocytophaga catalasegens]GJM52883.1 hypothetical protein RCZ16_12000 [Capnocytophaga catalasegens]